MHCTCYCINDIKNINFMYLYMYVHRMCVCCILIFSQQLSKQQQHTLLKGTHNITLNNPLRQQEETGELKKKHGHVSSPETKRQIIVLNV